MKIIFFIIYYSMANYTYSCTKGTDPVKPPTDTIPVVPFDSAYFLLLRDTMGKIAEISLDSNSLLWNKPLETIRGFYKW